MWVFRNSKFNECQAGEETVKKQKRAFLEKLERVESGGGYQRTPVALLGSPPRTVSSHEETWDQPCAEPAPLPQAESIVQRLRYVQGTPNLLLLI